MIHPAERESVMVGGFRRKRSTAKPDSDMGHLVLPCCSLRISVRIFFIEFIYVHTCASAEVKGQPKARNSLLPCLLGIEFRSLDLAAISLPNECIPGKAGIFGETLSLKKEKKNEA